MPEEQKKILEQQLWNIANTLRGKMRAFPLLWLQNTRCNLECQHMRFITQGNDDVIAHNVHEMQNASMDVLVQSIDTDFPHSQMTDEGWTFDEGLYDKLKFEYTKLTDKLLKNCVR